MDPDVVNDENDDQVDIYYEPYDESAVQWLADMLRSHREFKAARDIVIQKHFGELTITPILEEQEKLISINEFINKEITYQPVFLGSTIGFNKNNWNKNIEKLLEPYSIKQKPLYSVKENCYLFEKLKYLALKYMERLKK